MTFSKRVSLLALFATTAIVGCGGSDDSAFNDGRDAPNGATAPSAPPLGESGKSQGAERAIAEADIVQIAAGRLYAMSKSGTLSIIDVSMPGRLAMLGQAYLPGEPFEMYLRGDLLVLMTNRAYSASGERTANANGSWDDASAAVMVVNIEDPALMQRVATFPAFGEIADSRIIGDVLYLATYENETCFRCGVAARTLVTTFDVKEPTTLRQVDQVEFGSTNRGAWGNLWKRSIVATPERLYVGGPGDLAPTNSQSGPDEGVIDVLDITDTTGKLRKGAHLTTTGAITSRWQMDEKDGVLRVVSQRGSGYATNGIGSPTIQTFHIWNAGSIQPLGQTTMNLPRQEALKSVRFDGPRAYAITFQQTDPLFVLDLSVPESPRQRGELHMPGWVFHLEPRGDRLLGLGLDRNNSQGHLNVSLFDVADMDKPRMLTRVDFGSTSHSDDQGIVSYELPEDQDRIQKAFRMLEGGLVVVPYSNAINASNCQSGGGVQLIDWSLDTLVRRATLPVAGNPRRALLNQGELLAVSDSNVTSFDIARRDNALKTADLVIGSCESRPIPTNVSPGMNEGDWNDVHYDDDYRGHCSFSARGPRRSLWAVVAGAVAALAAVRRRRSSG